MIRLVFGERCPDGGAHAAENFGGKRPASDACCAGENPGELVEQSRVVNNGEDDLRVCGRKIGEEFEVDAVELAPGWCFAECVIEAGKGDFSLGERSSEAAGVSTKADEEGGFGRVDCGSDVFGDQCREREQAAGQVRRRAGAVRKKRKAFEGRTGRIFNDEAFATGEQLKGLFARGENELGVAWCLFGAGDCDRARRGIDAEELGGIGGDAEHGTETGEDPRKVCDRGAGSHEHDRSRRVELFREGECAFGEAWGGARV